MSIILEADETGTLHLPPSLLPHPGPRRRYRVANEAGQVVVDELEVVAEAQLQPEDSFAAMIGAFSGASEATGRSAEEILYGKDS